MYTPSGEIVHLPGCASYEGRCGTPGQLTAGKIRAAVTNVAEDIIAIDTTGRRRFSIHSLLSESPTVSLVLVRCPSPNEATLCRRTIRDVALAHWTRRAPPFFPSPSQNDPN